MKIEYSLCVVLTPFTVKGVEVDREDSLLMSNGYESIEELVEQTPMLAFITKEDIKTLESEIGKVIDWFNETRRLEPEKLMGNLDSYLPEVGGIWSSERDGMDYLYSPNEINLQGVESLFIFCKEVED